MPSPYHEEHDGYLGRYVTTGEAKIIGRGREVMGRRRDGSVFPLHLSVGQMMIGDERKFTGILHDLSDRVELEHRLKASEARWRAVIDSAVDGIVVIDAHARIEAFNPAAERLFGYTEKELLGQNVHVLMPSPYHEEHDMYLTRYLATGRAKIIGTGREVTGRRRDGTTFPMHLSVGEVTVEGERKFTGIVHDLTSRVQLEERLREGATLAKIGEMAAVIAHEVKNPLAGIRGAIQVIGGRAAVDSRDSAVLNDIVKRIDALDSLMKDLLVFARPPQPRRASVDVVPLVTMTADLLCQDPSLKEIRIEVDGSAPPLLIDAEMLKIVFQNLLLNSAHAMQGQGKIDVAIAAIDGVCEIAFTDSGPGIPEEIRDKLFTAFFTTKSRGSGLGLATAKRLVEAHQGVIAVECPPTGGTRVTIRLPVSKDLSLN
jgi:PAS domain S-box-containing protein